jgi:hypothetical protein
MIYIEYSEYGIAISDFEHKEWLDRLKETLCYNKKFDNIGYDTKFAVSTSLPISAVRLAICRGEIDNAHIAFIYKNKIFQTDKNGRIADWPRGFADIEGDLTEDMLTCQVKRHKVKENVDKGGINDVI